MKEHKVEFFNFLREIKKRPPMFIGEASIRNLYTFLLGYNIARDELQVMKTTEEKQFQEFQQWLQKKYNIKTTESWANLILIRSSDEAEAFYRFYDLLDEFSKNFQGNNTKNDTSPNKG